MFLIAKVHINAIWASTRENLSSGVGADQPQSDLCYSIIEKYHI